MEGPQKKKKKIESFEFFCEKKSLKKKKLRA